MFCCIQIYVSKTKLKVTIYDFFLYNFKDRMEF